MKPLNVGVRAPERDPALAQRLHLRAREHHPGLVALEQVVLMPGTAVVRDHFHRVDKIFVLVVDRPERAQAFARAAFLRVASGGEHG